MNIFGKITTPLAAAIFSSLLCAPAVCAPRAPAVTPGGIEFRFDAPKNTGRITLAGDFNSWNPDTEPLKYDSSRGLWCAQIALGEGKYEYKYVVDGKWAEGANLIVEVVNKDGKISAVVPASPSNTPYSGKINFSGKFVSEAGVDRVSSDGGYFAMTPLNHFDLDWGITVSKEAKAFARLEYDDTDSAGKILFKQGSLDFSPPAFSASANYKKKSVQFDDPLRAADRPVALKYSDTEFFDEPNPHKAFGLWEHTLSAKAGLLGGELSAFYADMLSPSTNYRPVEDDYGLRWALSPGDVPLKLGVTTRYVRGGWWPWANAGDNWFPDPEKAGGYSLVGSTRGAVATWYKGFLNSDFVSADAAFYFLPWLTVFGEVAAKSEELKTEAISGNIAHNKIWRLRKSEEILAGGKFSFGESFAAQIGAGKENIDFAPPLYSPEKFAVSKESLRLDVRWRAGNFSAGVSAADARNSRLNKDIPLDLDPRAQNLMYAGLFPYETASSGFLVRALERDESVAVSAGYSPPGFSVGAKSRLRRVTAVPEYFTAGVLMASSAASPPDEIIFSESLLDASVGLLERLSAETALRIFSWNEKGAAASRIFCALFVALKYGVGKDSYVRLGWGLDPEGTDDDISADFDRRDTFLYNNRGTDVLDDADALSRLSRISLRAALRF